MYAVLLAMIHEFDNLQRMFFFVVGDNFYGKRRFRSKMLVISIADDARVRKGVAGGGGRRGSRRYSLCVCVCVCAGVMLDSLTKQSALFVAYFLGSGTCFVSLPSKLPETQEAERVGEGWRGASVVEDHVCVEQSNGVDVGKRTGGAAYILSIYLSLLSPLTFLRLTLAHS